MNIFSKAYNNFINKRSYFGLIENKYSSETRRWDEKNPLTAYNLSLYLNACVRKRAEKLGGIVFKLLNQNGENQKENELLKVLNKPNNLLGKPTFWTLYQTYLDLYGEAYFYIKSNRELFEVGKKIIEIHLLLPPAVKPKNFNNETLSFDSYDYVVGGKTISYNNSEIIRIFNPDPKNQLNPFNLIRAGVSAISTELQLRDYQSNILKNGGRVESVFKFKTQRLNPKQLEELKDQYIKQVAGARKSGTPLFLGGDSDYQAMGLKPEELAFLESKRATLNDICLMTGVPRTLLSNVDEIKYSNAQASIRIFLEETIKPLMTKLVGGLEVLVPSGYTLSFEDPVPENIELELKKLETANTVGALTTNEKRKRLGYDPVKEGDKILIPFNLIELGEGSLGEESSKKNFRTAHPLKNEKARRKYHEMYIRKTDRKEESMIRELRRYFKEQEGRILDRIEGKGVTKNLIDDSFNAEMEIRIAFNEFKPILERELADAGVEAMAFANSDFTFNITNQISSWLQNKTEIFAEQINKTTFDKLQKEFTESLAQSETRPLLVKRIQNVYGDIKKSRATTIARTEIQGIVQKGTFEGYRQANVPIKIWVAVMDMKTRPSHAMIDGEEKPIDMPFSNGLQFPGEPGGPSGEVINCRCTI